MKVWEGVVGGREMAVARREDVAWREAEVHHDPQNGKSASASLAPPTNQLHPPTF